MAVSLAPLTHRTKGQLLSERLRQLAHELGPNAKLPTVVELKSSLAVSLTTLTAALEELEARGIIERKHGVGIFVSPRLGQRTVGVLCDPAFFAAGVSPFWSQLIEGIRKRSGTARTKYRFYLAIPSKHDDIPVHDDVVEDVREQRLDGMVILGHNKPAVFWLKAQGVPTMAFAGYAEHCVQIDMEDLVRQAARLLLEQGVSDIGLLVPSGLAYSDAPLQAPPVKALQSFCAEQGISFRPDSVWEGSKQDESVEVQGYRAARQLFARPKASPKGLVSVDDLMTRGALSALTELGLVPGKDVRIASHTNVGSDLLAGHEAHLDRLEIDGAAIVESLFDTLELLMSGRPPPQKVISIRARSVPSRSRTVASASRRQRTRGGSSRGTKP
jgi:DNA-binding LacI/PurR family transcriptional regulator